MSLPPIARIMAQVQISQSTSNADMRHGERAVQQIHPLALQGITATRDLGPLGIGPFGADLLLRTQAQLIGNAHGTIHHRIARGLNCEHIPKPGLGI